MQKHRLDPGYVTGHHRGRVGVVYGTRVLSTKYGTVKHSSRVVSVLDAGAEEPGFKSQP